MLKASRRHWFTALAASITGMFSRGSLAQAQPALLPADQKTFRAFKKRNELLKHEQRQAIESARASFPDVDQVRWRVFSESARSFVKIENVVQAFIGYRVDSNDYTLTLIDVDGLQTSLVLAGAAENQVLPVRYLVSDRAYNPAAIEVNFLNSPKDKP